MEPDLSLLQTLEKLGIALGLGLLIGMQRERTDSRLAGFRTFPLTTMFGTVAGLLALRFGGWIVAAGLASLAALLISDNFTKPKTTQDIGVTTEVTVFLMFGVGAYLVFGYASIAVALVGTVALLLHLKPEMHAFAHRMGDKDFKAIMQFVLITLVILPILPHHDYGPYHALNPHKIWLTVVLIVGLSLAGYIAFKFLGPSSGSILAGVIGGLISSTATTVAFARRSRESSESASLAVLVIVLASATLFARLLVLIGVLAPQMFEGMAGPIGTMLGFIMLVFGVTWLFTHKGSAKMPAPRNPTEWKAALIFGGVFVATLLAVPAAKQYFGANGLYALSAVSGLADLDAITVSTLQMGGGNQQGAGTAWRMIMVAAMANLVFKTGVTAVLGTRKLFAWTGLLFGIAFAAGALILWVWPTG